MNSFKKFLRNRLHSNTLPGRTLQLKMAPEPVEIKHERRRLNAPPNATPGSVLILLFPNNKNDLELVFTLRSSHINHGGQISFPGGRSENNETPVQTALREAEEEIGIEPNDVTVAGALSNLYVQPTDNNVTPIVGFLNYKPRLSLNPDEVEEAFCVKLDALLDEKNITSEKWELRKDARYKVPFWNVHRVPLWGATAMILSEFLEIYREFKSQTSNDQSNNKL